VRQFKVDGSINLFKEHIMVEVVVGVGRTICIYRNFPSEELRVVYL